MRSGTLATFSAAVLCVSASTVFGQEDGLTRLVHTYFKADEEKQRADVLSRIESAPGYSLQALKDAVERVNLWPVVEPGDERFVLPFPQKNGTEVFVRLPSEYTTRRRWPMILFLHGQGGQAKDMLRLAGRFEEAAGEEFIFVAPQEMRGGWFHRTQEESNEPLRLLIALRKRYRVDSDRVYVSGYSKGGHETCMLSLLLADRWAGAVPMAGTMILPQRELLYADVLPNLQHLPMLVCWGALDVQAEGGRMSPTGGIAKANRVFTFRAKKAGVPIQGVELENVGHLGVQPPTEPLREILTQKRQKYPTEVSHWFRYQAQARSYWLSSRRFRGQPWRGSTLHVRIKSGEDHRAKLVGIIKDKLGYIKGKIEGQTIRLEMRHVAEAEVLLNDELVSLDEPVRVLVEDREVFRGRLKRRAKVLLETIARDHDFQRLFTARIVIPYRKKAIEE